MRPAHLHFMIYKPGFKTIASQVYVQEDPLPRDRLAVRRHQGADRRLPQAARRQLRLTFTFTIEPGEARRPKAPISAKALA